MISTIPITPECLERQYHGCGKAWAAVQNGKIIAMRYIGERRIQTAYEGLPAWVKAVNDNAEGRDNRMLPTAWSSRGLGAMAAAASECSDCPRKIRGGKYRPRELLTMARAVLIAADAADFAAWRALARAELAELGTVVGGICSCAEFVVLKVE